MKLNIVEVVAFDRVALFNTAMQVCYISKQYYIYFFNLNIFIDIFNNFYFVASNRNLFRFEHCQGRSIGESQGVARVDLQAHLDDECSNKVRERKNSFFPARRYCSRAFLPKRCFLVGSIT